MPAFPLPASPLRVAASAGAGGTDSAARAVLLNTGHRLVQAAALAGAVVPSSRFLAQAMAQATRGATAIVELGAGTGPVTRALALAHPGLRLVVVELRKDLALALRREFPQAEVHAATAASVLDGLTALPAGTGVVSSLPFRSLPRLVKLETVASVLRFLAEGTGRFLVQFTYAPGVPFHVPPGFRWRKVDFVAFNLPPAAVWVLRPEGADGPVTSMTRPQETPP